MGDYLVRAIIKGQVVDFRRPTLDAARSLFDKLMSQGFDARITYTGHDAKLASIC